MADITPFVLPEHLAARRAAQRSEVSVQAIAIGIAIACFVSAAFLVPRINAIRREKQLVIDPVSIAGLPPEIALLGKLGTFRALVIDWAAIRSERLKEEGKVYEAMTLHETVCALAPRFPRMWAYAAWNMAYNISVMQFTPEARWQWVNNGIKILRDKGIQYNPKSVALYKELSWIYWHKIGDFLDDEHWNYKRALAVEMERVLGAPPVAVTDQDYFHWFKRIVDAPRDLHRFLRDDEIARLVSQLREVNLAPDDSLLDFVARHLRSDLQMEQLLKEKPGEDSLFARRMQILSDPKTQPTLDRLLAAIRSDVLRLRYHFDIDWMYDLMVNQYGPIDWRNAFSHSLYWSSWGDKVTEGVAATDENESMNNARFVFFSLQSLIGRGRITLTPDFDDPFNSHVELTPDTRLIPYLYDTFMRLGKKQFGNDLRYVEGTPGPNYMTGFITDMHNWIELLYLEGGERNLKQAENYLAWLREHNPEPDGRTIQPQYLKTVEEFVMGDILAQLKTHRAATAVINSFLLRGLKHLSVGETASGWNAIGRAKLCYDYWMADTTIDYNDRRMLTPMPILLRDQVMQYMRAPNVDAIAKVRLWRVLPLQQQQMVYDAVQPYFVKLCETRKPVWSVQAAFPEPAGMQEFRALGVQDRHESPQDAAERGKDKK